MEKDQDNSNNINKDTSHKSSHAESNDTHQTGSNETNNAHNNQANRDDKGDSKKFGWDKVREFFEEFELSNQGMQYPMTIITVSCLVIAVCVIFMTFTQLKLLKTFQKLYVVSRYGF